MPTETAIEYDKAAIVLKCPALSKRAETPRWVNMPETVVITPSEAGVKVVSHSK